MPLNVSEIHSLHRSADLLRWHAQTNDKSTNVEDRQSAKLALALEAIAARYGTGLTREAYEAQTVVKAKASTMEVVCSRCGKPRLICGCDQ